MPIPPQNDFLLPFLQILSDGNTYMRSQLLIRLAKHFNISEHDARQMSGQQITLVSRVAWCDIHFVKAGFVTKIQHHSDSSKDGFRITSLGIRELNRRHQALTVGYLQGFYRSKVYRGAGSDDSTSEAERELYERFDQLPDDFTVIHGVKWFARTMGTVGEIDFLIAHRQYGILVLEVKGGEAFMERGQWLRRNPLTGKVSDMRDPCEQADRNRWALRDWLNQDSRTNRYRYALFPAVALPDSRVQGNIRPDCPQDIFIDITHLDTLETRLLEIFDYWKPRADGANQRMDGKTAVDALVELFVPTRKLQPRIADIFERERRKIEELTQQQFRILQYLRYHRRAAIVGGAGTGKTMVAMEKTQQLLDEGYRVLFLCFNQNLKQWLELKLRHPNLMIATFHGLVGHAINWARVPRGRGDFYTEAPDLLMSAVHVLQSEKSGTLFDAIIVDEAQDFEDTWWIPLPDLLKDPQTGVFYVFFDDNQRIYQQMSNIPMQGEPLTLSDNCRNTQHIHARMAAYAKQNDDIVCLGPEGHPVEIIPAVNAVIAKRELQRVLHRLVNEDGIECEDIIILTGASERRSQWKQDERLGNFVLSWHLDTEIDMAICVSSIFTYKGLEAAVVILTELNQAREDIRDQLIYVGLSRARHYAIVIGTLPEPTHHS